MPRLVAAFAVSVAVDDDSVGSDCDLGGLAGYSEAGQHTPTGLSDGPGVALFLAVLLDVVEAISGVDIDGVERDFIGVVGPYLLQAP